MPRIGYSVLELVVGLSLALIICGAGAPVLLATREGILADGAAGHLVSQLHAIRMEALKRRASVAIRFEPAGNDYVVAVYVDGNSNGVLSADIANGVDTPLGPRETLGQRFAGVRFGFEDGVPDADGVPITGNADPIRAGRSRMLSFSPTGTSSSGTVYLHGRGHHQLAVRVLGGTGRIRCLSYDFGAGRWQPR